MSKQGAHCSLMSIFSVGMIALALAIVPTAPLRAQPSQATIELSSLDHSSDVVIGACSSVIESGLLRPSLLAGMLTRRGHAFYVSGQFAAVLADYTRAAQLVPDRAVYYRNIGALRSNLLPATSDALAIAEQLEKSLLDFNRAIALDPKDNESLVRRGAVYVALGRIERGLDDLDQAVARDPNSATTRDARGRAHLARNDFARAIADFDAALRLEPTLTSARLNRGIAHDRMEDYASAIDAFTAVIEQTPSSAGAFNNRGTSHAKRGRTEQAIEDFSQAILLDPRFAGAYFNRGQAIFLKGDKDRALADYIQARQISPQFPEPSADLFEDYQIDVPGEYRPRRPFRN